MINVLFVCMGNTCRSPIAEGVARRFIAQSGIDGRISFDSAGTHPPHEGKPPDPRAQQVAAARGYDITKLKARKVRPDDFEKFDLILVMDNTNLTNLARMCPGEHRHKVRLFLSFVDKESTPEVPDPYFSSLEGFQRVVDLCEQGVEALILAVLRESTISFTKTPPSENFQS